MNWYYVNQGQQAGPFTEEELLSLVHEGKISEETLVWREGMQGWTAFHQAGIPTAAPPIQHIVPPSPPPLQTNPNEAVCAECGKIVPLDETIQHRNLRVCATCKPLFLQKLAEGAKLTVSPAGQELHYAGFWIRVGAWLLDWLVVFGPLMIITFAFFALAGVSSNQNRNSGVFETLGMFFGLFLMFGARLLQAGYQIFFVGKYGATLGKMACRIKVVSDDGSRISYGRATARAFAEWLSRLTFGIGYLMTPFDTQKRALHDHICSTRVVHK